MPRANQSRTPFPKALSVIAFARQAGAVLKQQPNVHHGGRVPSMG